MLAGIVVASLTQSITAGAGPFLPVSDTPRWGFQNGIQVAIHPAAIGTGGSGGPRGLLRIGYPILRDGGVSLIDFIAVEPTVAGRKGYSELELSADGRPGKVISVAGSRRYRRAGHEMLTVTLDVERFQNGAHVRLEVQFNSTRPDEVELRAYAEPDSATMAECALTATMGNFERLRRVHLAGRVLESGTVYAGFTGTGFARDTFAPLADLARDEDGDAIVPATPDEADARILQSSLPPNYFWRYPGTAVTQYWRAPRGSFSPSLRLRLNARRTYYMTETPLPGGVAFENFELQDRFRSGQPFIFGVTTKQPSELMRARHSRSPSRLAWKVWD